MKIFRKIGVSTLINLLGMSVAFAAAMILMVQVRWDTTYDKNFEDYEQVFKLENNWFSGNERFGSLFNRSMIEQMRKSSPNLEALTVMWFDPEGGFFYRDENKDATINLPSMRADSNLLSVMPFEWVEGSGKEFTANGTAIMSEEYAAKFFDNETAIGKSITDLDGESVRIVGVFKDWPHNSSMNYGLIKNIGTRFIDDTDEWSFSAFAKLKDPLQAEDTKNAMLEAVIAFFKDYIKDYIPEEDMEDFSNGFRITNLHKAHFERDVTEHTLTANKNITITLAAITILLILIAIINFINFAFAEIPFRIKNINTRKVLGEGRTSLILKQLLYAVLIASLAWGLASLLMHLVGGSSLASYVSGSLAIKDNIPIVALMLGVALLSAVIAGIAPAIYSTSQPAALVLKGAYSKSVRGRSLRSILVGLQFVLSFIFILTALYVRIQTKYMISKGMGFDREQVLQVGCGYEAGEQKDALEEKLLQNPSIEAVTFSHAPLVSTNKMQWGRVNEGDGRVNIMTVLPVADNFIDFFGIEIVEGRNFMKSDNQGDGCYIANESLINAYPKWRLGSKITGHQEDVDIDLVGVVKDFNFQPLQYNIGPIMLYNWGKEPWTSFPIAYVRMAAGADYQEVTKYIKDAVCAIDPIMQPDIVAVHYFDEWIERLYSKESSLGKLITIASLIALLIAVIGIIGLVFFETQFLRKEIAVRRVNGATVKSILGMINRKYLVITAVSFIVAAPIAYWIIVIWRQGFAYQHSVPVWIFVAALALGVAITLMVVTLQSLRAANANPVESLKNE